MKKTNFKGVELAVIHKFCKTYEDSLEEMGIEYKDRTIDLLDFDALTPARWSEITYKSPKDGSMIYAYECSIRFEDGFYTTTYASKHRFSDEDINDLEAGMENLIYKDSIAEYKKFNGYKEGEFIFLRDLIGKYIEYNDLEYRFDYSSDMPEGVHGNVVYTDSYGKEHQESEIFITPLGIKKENKKQWFVVQFGGSLPRIMENSEFMEMFGEKN